VTEYQGPERAMVTLDEAINTLNSTRSRIGALQNRLEYASNSLAETSEDMTSAYSTLIDTDMAEEMTTYTQANVLEQASISVLSQANDIPQTVLSLLQ
jgi:flagellin